MTFLYAKSSFVPDEPDSEEMTFDFRMTLCISAYSLQLLFPGEHLRRQQTVTNSTVSIFNHAVDSE